MNNNNPFGITKEELLEVAANKLLAQLDHSDNDLYTRAAEKIDKEVKSMLATKLAPKIDELLTEKIMSLMETEVAPVNLWGEQTGKPTKIRDTFEQRARTFWDCKVNSEGQPTNDHYGCKTRAEWMYNKVASDAFATALKQDVVNVIGAFKVQLQAKMAEHITAAINDLVRVRTDR